MVTLLWEFNNHQLCRGLVEIIAVNRDKLYLIISFSDRLYDLEFESKISTCLKVLDTGVSQGWENFDLRWWQLVLLKIAKACSRELLRTASLYHLLNLNSSWRRCNVFNIKPGFQFIHRVLPWNCQSLCMKLHSKRTACSG